MKRREFFEKTFAAGALSTLPFVSQGCQSEKLKPDYEKLDEAAAKPVLKKELFPNPVIIETMELLRYKDNFICLVRSKDGAEGLSVSHNFRMIQLYPLCITAVFSFFHGKDARELDNLIDQVYLHQSNYKLQNMALWIPVATAELAILDMLGNISGKTMGELVGDIHNTKVAVYLANNYRGRSAEESVDLIKRDVHALSAKALKFKIGGRMRTPDKPAGRTEKIIKMMRKTFGSEMAIYTDANGAYNADEAIKVGKILEEYQIDLYEEPVPFDWYEDMKIVSDALTIPMASGGGEASMRNFRWMIANKVHEMYQQDLFYFGGIIRCMKVARMAEAAGYVCTPHISGTGLGYLYMMQFVSAIPNAGPYHEYKGLAEDIPFECKSSTLKVENGEISIPKEPGDGIDIDPDYIKKHEPITI